MKVVDRNIRVWLAKDMQQTKRSRPFAERPDDAAKLKSSTVELRHTRKTREQEERKKQAEKDAKMKKRKDQRLKQKMDDIRTSLEVNGRKPKAEREDGLYNYNLKKFGWA